MLFYAENETDYAEVKETDAGFQVHYTMAGKRKYWQEYCEVFNTLEDAQIFALMLLFPHLRITER